MHHAGLLPIVKEVVEMLFCRGVVKVKFYFQSECFQCSFLKSKFCNHSLFNALWLKFNNVVLACDLSYNSHFGGFC